MSKNAVGNIAKSRKIVADLEARFLEGERLTLEDVIKEYFNSNQLTSYLRAKDIVRGWFHTLKTRFTNNHGLWFGCLNDMHQFGLVNTEEEAVYAQGRYYALTKGLVTRAIQLKDESVSKGFLKNPQEERLLLPKIVKVIEK